ncbi:hypothetical protein Q31b_46460 [Novipirellula aureliae]|uniref:Uncharacterized protein n=1 Tax=Novipirellula aureliae TaxID=2527966 RepID=A0A5C6DPS6_9BACT|nr:hypothetical protein Q31b_46460 [Novipirellula aureliae]
MLIETQERHKPDFYKNRISDARRAARGFGQSQRSIFQTPLGERHDELEALARIIHGLANCFANVYAFKRLRSLLEKQSAY